MLYRQRIPIVAKPFAMGVRVEHPQALIDEIQYHGAGRDYLPAAAYSLVGAGGRTGCLFVLHVSGGRDRTGHDRSGRECVVNGMSDSGRNSRWANSGIVTEVPFPILTTCVRSGANWRA